MKTQARHGAKIDAECQLTTQETAGVFKTGEDFSGPGNPFDGRYIDICKSQLTVDRDICDENLAAGAGRLFREVEAPK